MDTRTLSYIIAIAEEKSISKAAERLYMAQSSLSQYLTTLETSLGYPLFVRRHQGVRLTEAGKLYLEFAYRTINAYHQVQDAMQDISELHSGQVILGVSTFRGSYLLPPVITAFANKYPGVHVNIVEGDSVDLEYMLQRGDLDLALLVLGKAAKNLDSAFLMDDEICLIAHPHHPIMKKVRKGTRHNLQETPPWFIDIHEISQYEFILSGYDTILGKKAREIFARHHISPIVHNENLSALFAASMGSGGIGLAFTYYSSRRYFQGAEFISLGKDGTSSVKDLPGILMETVGTSAMIFAIMIGASLFGFVLTILQVPQALTMMVAEVEVSRWVFFILINLLLLFLGCILETVSIIFITVPILYPIIKQLGFDPIWFNVVMQINMEMALITPPVGMNLFVLKGVSPESRMEDIIRGVIPYIGVMAVEILFLCFVPELATWLPSVVK